MPRYAMFLKATLFISGMHERSRLEARNNYGLEEMELLALNQKKSSRHSLVFIKLIFLFLLFGIFPCIHSKVMVSGNL